MIYYLIALIVLLLDQASKWYIRTRMSPGESWAVLGDFFQITSQRNRGAAFSILQNQRWFFLLITLFVVAGILWYLRKTIRSDRLLLSAALGLLLGGAVGNFIDRALFGEVTDFLQFSFQFAWFGKHIDYTYPIFNLADSAIVVGVVLIFLDTLLDWRKEKRGKGNESHGSRS